MILFFLNLLTDNVTAQTNNSTQLLNDEANKLLNAVTNATANSSAESMNKAGNVLSLASEAAANATESAMNEARNLLSNVSSAAITSSFNNCNPKTTDTVSNSSSATSKIYSNTNYKFSIQYPSSWQVQDNKDCLPLLSSVVEFSLVSQPNPQIPKDNLDYTLDPKTSLRIDISDLAEPYLDTDTMSLKNYTARSYAQSELSSLSDLPLERNFKEIRENELNIASQPGWKIEYFVDDFFDNYTYNFEVFTIIDSKLYTFHYSAKPTNVPHTYQLANMMVSSLKLVR